ncbi:orexigenic neuropeptide QRFP isoform X1 [Cricetulus griseus]|uniref:Orexigenic neuropeptide QRFP isoform X1 n=1 Tax=Cricetulus griseus TaxID=10029 RepID=A0A9J7GBB1_CRIGR|nr:orexigenic neuropeptide QRFP isoform X1 [Cricetulus griseus]
MTQGICIKQGTPKAMPTGPGPKQLCLALGPRDSPALPTAAHRTMRSLHTLPYLLLLPLSTCFPLLDRRGPTDIDDIRAKMSWANPVEERRPHSVQDPFLWLRVPQPQALLVVAKELQSSHREHTGFRLGRRDRSSQAAGFLPTDAEKASRPLGTLAEELSSYSRRKGGFSFRFGR